MLSIIYLLKKFKKVDLFHVLRANNDLAYGHANTGEVLEQGSLSINKDVMTCHIP